MPVETGAPSAWLLLALLVAPVVALVAAAFVNRRFQRRDRQPAQGVLVGAHPLEPDESAFLQGVTYGLTTHRTTRKRKIATGYVSPQDGKVVVCRHYRTGVPAAYVGIVDLSQTPEALDFHAHPLHLASRIVAIASLVTFVLSVDLPLWSALLLALLLGWVFWYDHTNERADLLSYLHAVMKKQAAPPAPVAARASRKNQRA